MNAVVSDHDARTQKVLLIGDVDAAISAGDLNAGTCTLCPNMLDGIEAAAKEDFAVIGVVMNGKPMDLKSALQTLSRIRPHARLVLLVQMYQEPAARELIVPRANGMRLAADYFICPTRLQSLVSPATQSGTPAVTPQIAESVLPHCGPKISIVTDNRPHERLKQLEKLATEDDLTSLKNRRYVWEFARQIIERAKGMASRVTLLVFDIDDFKHYNDVYGHPFGDEILKQAAVLMRRCCRTHDVVARIGGDEFAVVFWEDPRLKAGGLKNERRSAEGEPPVEAISVVNRFRRELGNTNLSLLGPAGKGLLTISGGLASFPRDGATPDELFRQADRALLEAKRSGKNRIYLVGKPESDIGDIDV